ncbi:tetratricopeptide repeat protein [Bizionia psychrotolerans]|uniref:tetratricopeptide repeat protein n=1 Tax=Bizionia psychrotolerans TaxID=1492901 RepID=UPI00065086E0|nr:tetratricopeptide repeat protein [Bizionia psychrotolerans]
MARLLKLSLSICLILCVFSCQNKREKAEASYKFGVSNFGQGSAGSINGIARAIEIDSTYEQAVYELSVGYLKRGMPHMWKEQYDKAVLLDSVTRVPWRGYLYLWFYRDYKKAITDFDASDTLTPNFTDQPQGHSVDYWRGVAYLGLNDYDNSISYFDTYINQEIDESGEDWVELTAFLYRGIAYYESGNYEKAFYNFEKRLEHGRNISADAKYYMAIIAKEQGQIELAEELINAAIEDFKQGYFNNRPYVETLRQIYLEDLLIIKSDLTL